MERQRAHLRKETPADFAWAMLEPELDAAISLAALRRVLNTSRLEGAVEEAGVVCEVAEHVLSRATRIDWYGISQLLAALEARLRGLADLLVEPQPGVLFAELDDALRATAAAAEA